LLRFVQLAEVVERPADVDVGADVVRLNLSRHAEVAEGLVEAAFGLLQSILSISFGRNFWQKISTKEVCTFGPKSILLILWPFGRN
jgi:hypothetical protein